MKINCQSCGAKYTIADDKVRGRTVKIRCKKCGSAIVVSGSEVATARAGDEEQETKIFETAPPPEGASSPPDGAVEWTINVAEGDQRTGTTDEIISLLASGVITGDTYVWRDGMADWAPLSEVPDLLDRIQGPRAGEAAEQAPAQATPAAAEPAAQLPQTSNAKLSQPAAPIARGGDSAPAPDHGVGSVGSLSAGASVSQSTAPKAVARRAEMRGRDQDLFGAAPAGAAESEAPESQPGGMFPKDKFTAERNENSVLFSLDALRAPKAKSAPPPAALHSEQAPPSGIVDIRRLASTAPPATNNADSRFDDIMSMGNAGLMTATLAAPVLPTTAEPEPPPVQMASVDLGEAPVKKSNTKFIVIAAAAVVVITVGGFLAFGRGQPVQDAKLSTPSSTAPTETAKPADTPAAAATSVAAAPADTPASASPAGTKADDRKESAPAVKGPLAVANQQPKDSPKPDTKPDTAPTAAAEVKTAEKAPETAPAAEFNRSAAVSALNAAAGGASGCKKADGPTGTGRVSVTFAPSGRVTTATVEGPPFAGTSVGGCVAARFRGASVPPFTGSPVTVHKSFSIN